MIELNWAAAGVVSTIFISLMCLAAWVGKVSERVQHNRKDIDKYVEENRKDHRIIFDKLDALRELIKNGGR